MDTPEQQNLEINQEIPQETPQQPNIPPVEKKGFNYPLLIGAVVALIIIIGGIVFLQQGVEFNTSDEVISEQAAGLVKDQPSSAYLSNIEQIDSQVFEGRLYREDGLKEKAQEYKEVISKIDIDFQNKYDDLRSIYILWTTERYALYVLSLTGDYCGDTEMGFSCSDSSGVKILDIGDKSVEELTKPKFGQWSRILYLIPSETFIALGSRDYDGEIVTSKPIDLKTLQDETTKSTTMIQNEFLLSFEEASKLLMVENLITRSVFQCRVSNDIVTEILSSGLQESYYHKISISPGGEKLEISNLPNSFVFLDIKAMWGQEPQDCFSDTNFIEIPNTNLTRGIDWYNDSKYFGVTDYSTDTLLYDTENSEVVINFPQELSKGFGSFGAINNYGYHSVLPLREGYSLEAIPGEGKMQLYLISSDSEKTLLAEYADSRSTKIFYERTLEYPVNRKDGATSAHILAGDVRSPDVWFGALNNIDENRVDILVMGHYSVIRDFLSVSFDPLTVSRIDF